MTNLCYFGIVPDKINVKKWTGMFQNNPLLAQLKQKIQEQLPKQEGIVKATDKGFGFLEVDSKTRFFIPPPFMKKCLHGDKVSAIIRTENEREQAEPEVLIEQGLTRFIARVKLFKGRLNVIPDQPQLKKQQLKAKLKDGLLESLNRQPLKDGDWVVAHLVKHALIDGDGFLAEISEKITDADDKIAPWWVTLAQNDLPNSEPQGQDIWTVVDDEALTRCDITDLPFVTIDGESTKDMDDALYIKKSDDGRYELTIAIADPTAYIQPDDPMDKVARQRGFTIYLPGRNIPMLPRSLADELCSLHQDQTRLALCCKVTIDHDGTINDDAHFFAATIRSHARLVYDEVSDWLENGTLATSTEWLANNDVVDVVATLHQFSQTRMAWREQHAVVFADRPDYHFELSDDNDVVAIHVDERRSANRIVEEAMITANICAGRILRDHFQSGVFNSHAGFKTDKINDALELINPQGSLEFDRDSITTLQGFSALRRWLAQQDSNYLEHRIRKYLSYSEIGNQPLPHYAMGLDIYATWTSPIRKYGDMINHRMLKAHILAQAPIQTPDNTIGAELMMHRRHHKIAERNISDWLYARTLIDEPEKATHFNAEIFDINRAGMRVRLLENGATAFIPSSVILDNKERIDCNNEDGTILIDKVVEYRLGDQLEVVLIEVNLDNRSIVAKPTTALAVTTDESI